MVIKEPWSDMIIIIINLEPTLVECLDDEILDFKNTDLV